MTQLDKNIAINLKRIRKLKNMSLDMMAEKTGVSKSMLGQIERGESNPTVATIAKIVEGIKISFEELIYPKMESIVIIDHDEIPAYREEFGEYKIKSIFPYDRHRSFDVFEITVEPGEECDAIMVDNESCEYITVLQGILTLETTQGNYEVSANHAIRLATMESHKYRNCDRSKLILNVFISYEGTGNTF